MIFAYRLNLSGEAQQLPSVKPQFSEVRFSTPSGNSNPVYLSGVEADVESDGIRFAIAAGKDFPLKVDDLSELFALGDSGDCLDMLCATDEIKGGKDERKTD